MGSAAPARPGWRLGLCLATAVVLSGCVQTTGDLVPPTTSTTSAASTPIPLNTGPAGAPQGTATAPGTTAAPAAAAPATPAKMVAAAPAAAPAPPPEKPVGATATTPPAPAAAPAAASGTGTEPFPTTAPATPAPVAATTPAASAPAKTADGFPNINLPPAQPTGTLLPPEERKRIISELEALRAKQGGPAPAAPPGTVKTLTTEAESHGAAAIKKIEACSEEGAADDPDCQAPSE